MDVWCFWTGALLQLWLGLYLIRRNYRSRRGNARLAVLHTSSISAPIWEQELVLE